MTDGEVLTDLMPLGVVLVAFDSSDVILDCLESLLASTGVALRIVVVDNGSSDGTPGLLRDWAAGRVPYTPAPDLPVPVAPSPKPLVLHETLAGAETGTGHAVALVETGRNTGFAGGVNRGLAELARLPGLDRFWVLNPDSVVPPDTARAFAAAPGPEGGFALMGGRVLYLERPDMIQIDGGTINRHTGITGNLNLFAAFSETPLPDPARMDFVTGASMVASRTFYEAAGPMREDYFLYYEEVDWALRRGALPLAFCPGAIVYHRGGSAIGSATVDRPASPFALYFKHRARMMFLRRFFPSGVLTGRLWSLAKAGQFLLKGFRPEAAALLRGTFGAGPPRAVCDRLSAATLEWIEKGAHRP